jgi:hypothetical protein
LAAFLVISGSTAPAAGPSNDPALRAATSPIGEGKFAEAKTRIEQFMATCANPELLGEAEGYRLYCVYQAGDFAAFDAGFETYKAKYPGETQMDRLRVCSATSKLARGNLKDAQAELDDLVAQCKDPGTSGRGPGPTHPLPL